MLDSAYAGVEGGIQAVLVTDFLMSLKVENFAMEPHSASGGVAIIGAGPAGLMAAERLSGLGHAVHVFDAKASVGRKFLMAGKGGMNLTHSEEFGAFASRYGASVDVLRPMLEEFGPQDVCEWVRDLGLDTFVGSSGRIFPSDMKAAPLLRAWLSRLRQRGVHFHMRHRWSGWMKTGELRFEVGGGVLGVQPVATVLALGGGSWSKLGSDGAWWPWLADAGVELSPLQSSNCGFDVKRNAGVSGAEALDGEGWSPHFAERFAGQPFKSVAIRFAGGSGDIFHRRGEFVATRGGVEGSLIYAVSSLLRDEILRSGKAVFHLDLLPAFEEDKVLREVAHPRGSRSLSSHLKGRLGLDGVKAAILREMLTKAEMDSPALLARAIKALPITVVSPRPMDEAISTAGGVCWVAVDARLMSRRLPGVFFAGEMLDWEAPTGGYLLTACLATGVRAAAGVEHYLDGSRAVDKAV